MNEWEKLAEEADRGLRGQGSIVLAMKRLVESLAAQQRSTDRLNSRTFWLTFVMSFLTLFQAVAAVIQICNFIRR